MSSVSTRKLTPRQYLEIERKAQFKSEFYRGKMLAMSGANREHCRLSANLICCIAPQLDSRPYDVAGSDMRVCVSRARFYTYPDLSILCDNPQFVDDYSDTLLNPKVLVEIFSDLTEKYDRGEKMTQYMQIESLQEYVLVSQSTPRVEVYHRRSDGQWNYSDASSLDASVTLESVGITLPLSEIYLRVEFSDFVPFRQVEFRRDNCP